MLHTPSHHFACSLEIRKTTPTPTTTYNLRQPIKRTSRFSSASTSTGYSSNMNDRDAGAADGVGLNLPPPVVNPDDPLLIAQTLTYVTDDGSVLLSFTLAPFSFGAPSCGRCAMVSSLVALATRRPDIN